MNFIRILLIASTLALAGCASTPMKEAATQTIQTVRADESQVVFMRSSFLGAAISASLYDVSKGAPEFIGIVDNGTKIAYTTQPGKRVFMVVSEAADFMEAELLPGKTYYSLVTPRMGMWKARFSLWPIRTDGTSEYNTASESFNGWLTGTKLVENSPETLAWNTENLDSVKSKYAEYWAVWKDKSAEDLAARTLKPTDGK
ncbi:hypothetical protein O4G98_00850 [Zoogloeaceae bacterium G21618-S1]|nr:hypothetical protein [Zoogloeaceae bacterium G21618-S1]